MSGDQNQINGPQRPQFVPNKADVELFQLFGQLDQFSDFLQIREIDSNFLTNILRLFYKQRVQQIEGTHPPFQRIV